MQVEKKFPDSDRSRPILSNIFDAAVLRAQEKLEQKNIPEPVNPHGRRIVVATNRIASLATTLATWLAQSNEIDNHTYDLSAVNSDQLDWFCANVAGIGVEEVRAYRQELESMSELSRHFQTVRESAPQRARYPASIKWGRRIGWYVLVRHFKPKFVVETGVHFGLGAMAICAALRKNSNGGRYLGLDIDPKMGDLVRSFTDVAELRYGPSVETLKTVDCHIDMFIHDSFHGADYESQEYTLAEKLLSDKALVLSDNAHVCSKLANFAEATGRRFHFFKETPKNHFYEGAGIGVAVP